MTNGNVLGFLGAPSRDDCVNALSLAIVRIRASGITYKAIAQAADVSPDTIENAAAAKGGMLNFETIARIAYFWPDESAVIGELWGRAADAPTPAERIARIERELTALKRTAA